MFSLVPTNFLAPDLVGEDESLGISTGILVLPSNHGGISLQTLANSCLETYRFPPSRSALADVEESIFR